MRNHFQINGFALSLALKQRLEGTQKCPYSCISWAVHFTFCLCMYQLLPSRDWVFVTLTAFDDIGVTNRESRY